MQTFDMCPSPWIDEAEGEIWEDGVRLFHRWLWHKFGERYFYGHEVAEHLDVHREITDHWLNVVKSYELIDVEFIDIIPKNRTGEHEMLCYIVRETPEEGGAQPIVADELRDFDPWVDRSYDAEIPNLLWPDLTIDKYYDITFDEVKATTGKARRRHTHYPFMPVPCTELPRYASAKTWGDTRRADRSLPDPKWQAAIENAITPA
jgi:hypothetical protein